MAWRVSPFFRRPFVNMLNFRQLRFDAIDDVRCTAGDSPVIFPLMKVVFVRRILL